MPDFMLSLFNNIVNYFIENGLILIKTMFFSLVIFLGFYFGGKIISSILLNKFIKKISPELIKLLGQIINYTSIIIGLITTLSYLGIDVSAMIASLGLTGFALGFALKDILSNVISGILILIYKPFKINDTILIDKYEGEVIEINLRYTTVLQENKSVLVPNSFLFSKPIVVNKNNE
tara:strand:+ start:279 stop:809 length:531 start_codon:yes stop_codon:yes gene_type:complete